MKTLRRSVNCQSVMDSSSHEITGFGGTPDAVAAAVDFLKALSHEGRLHILCLLLDGEQSVGALSDRLGMQQASVSQQLMRLRAQGFVSTRRAGKMVFYPVQRPDVKPVILALRNAFCPAMRMPAATANDTGAMT